MVSQIRLGNKMSDTNVDKKSAKGVTEENNKSAGQTSSCTEKKSDNCSNMVDLMDQLLTVSNKGIWERQFRKSSQSSFSFFCDKLTLEQHETWLESSAVKDPDITGVGLYSKYQSARYPNYWVRLLVICFPQNCFTRGLCLSTTCLFSIHWENL